MVGQIGDNVESNEDSTGLYQLPVPHRCTEETAAQQNVISSKVNVTDMF